MVYIILMIGTDGKVNSESQNQQFAEIFNCRLSQVLDSYPSLNEWTTEIEKQLALTVCRWK